MKADVYVQESKENMYDKGLKLGLTGEALKNFMYTGYEVTLTVEIDEKTGNSTIIAVDGKPVVNKDEISKDDIVLVSQVMEDKGVWSHKFQAWNRIESFLQKIIGK